MEWLWDRRRRNLLVFCIFVLAGITVYWNSLGNPFHYDDQLYVEDNRNIRTLRNIPEFFTRPRTIAADPSRAGHYRPLVTTSYAVNYAIGGLDPAGYHAVNLAFHAGSAFLVFLIVHAMSAGAVPSAAFSAMAAGLIFLVHPFNSEVVNYITARSSVMSGFFYLLGFYWWVRFRGSGAVIPYIASILAFLGGMLSKEVVITLPVMFWVYDLVFHERWRSKSGTPHSMLRTLFDLRRYLPCLPFVVIVAVPYLVIRASAFHGVLTHFRRGAGTQLYTELPVLVKFLKLFILPAGLNIDHHAEIYKTFFVWPVAASAIALMLLIAAAVLSLRSAAGEWKMVSFFVLWFFVVMLPTTIIPLNAILQENRGYLAAVAFAVFAGVILGRLEIPSFDKGRLPVAALVILLAVYGVGTVYRNSVWKDGKTLWGDAVRKSPVSPRAYVNLGTAYARSGESDPAIRNFLRALELANPESGVDPLNIHYNLGSAYQQAGMFDMAVREYNVVIRINPGDPRPFYNLGIIYQKRNEETAALEAYQKVIERDPSDFRSYHNLGLLFQQRGDLAQAAAFYNKALGLNPDYEKSRFNLGAVYEAGGDSESAREAYISVIKRNPDYLLAYFSLGMLYEKEGRLNMAIGVYKDAAARFPENHDLRGRMESLEERARGR